MRRLLLAGLLSIGFVAVVMAQSTGTATLTGSVTDASGAVMPRANVTVSNPATGFVFTSVTTEEGTWYIPNLNPGFKMKGKDGFFRLLFALAFLPF